MTKVKIVSKTALLPLRVAPTIVEQFDEIKEREGFGNRSATFIYLLKFYKSKQQHDFEKAADNFGRALERIDIDALPDLRQQLGLSPSEL